MKMPSLTREIPSSCALCENCVDFYTLWKLHLAKRRATVPEQFCFFYSESSDRIKFFSVDKIFEYINANFSLNTCNSHGKKCMWKSLPHCCEGEGDGGWQRLAPRKYAVHCTIDIGTADIGTTQ